MGKITSLFCILLWISCQLLSATGLSCYRCRIDVCNHKYCNVTTNTLAVAGFLDESLPSCPNSESGAEWSEPAHLHHCQPTEVCGHSLYNIITSYNSVEGKNVTQNANFPVIVQVNRRLQSWVHVFGCMNASHIACPLLPARNLELGMEPAVERVTVANKVSTCCQCTTDLCNNGTKIDNKQCALVTRSVVLEHEDTMSNTNTNASNQTGEHGHSHGQGLTNTGTGTLLQWRYINAFVIMKILVTIF